MPHPLIAGAAHTIRSRFDYHHFNNKQYCLHPCACTLQIIADIAAGRRSLPSILTTHVGHLGIVQEVLEYWTALASEDGDLLVPPAPTDEVAPLALALSTHTSSRRVVKQALERLVCLLQQRPEEALATLAPALPALREALLLHSSPAALVTAGLQCLALATYGCGDRTPAVLLQDVPLVASVLRTAVQSGSSFAHAAQVGLHMFGTLWEAAGTEAVDGGVPVGCAHSGGDARLQDSSWMHIALDATVFVVRVHTCIAPPPSPLLSSLIHSLCSVRVVQRVVVCDVYCFRRSGFF